MNSLRITVVFITSFCFGVALADGSAVSLAELEAKFAGKMMGYVGDGDKVVFNADGEATLLLNGGYRRTGTYTLKEGNICFNFANLSYCDQVESGKYYILDRNNKRKDVQILN